MIARTRCSNMCWRTPVAAGARTGRWHTHPRCFWPRQARVAELEAALHVKEAEVQSLRSKLPESAAAVPDKGGQTTLGPAQQATAPPSVALRACKVGCWSLSPSVCTRALTVPLTPDPDRRRPSRSRTTCFSRVASPASRQSSTSMTCVAILMTVRATQEQAAC